MRRNFRFKACEKYGYIIKAETYDKAKQRFNKLMPKKYRL